MTNDTENLAILPDWPKKETLDIEALRGSVGRLDSDEQNFLETRDDEDREKGYASNELFLWGQMTAQCLRRIEEVLEEDEKEGVKNLDELKSEAREWFEHLRKLSREIEAAL